MCRLLTSIYLYSGPNERKDNLEITLAAQFWFFGRVLLFWSKKEKKFESIVDWDFVERIFLYEQDIELHTKTCWNRVQRCPK